MPERVRVDKENAAGQRAVTFQKRGGSPSGTASFLLIGHIRQIIPILFHVPLLFLSRCAASHVYNEHITNRKREQGPRAVIYVIYYDAIASFVLLIFFRSSRKWYIPYYHILFPLVAAGNVHRGPSKQGGRTSIKLSIKRRWWRSGGGVQMNTKCQTQILKT